MLANTFGSIELTLLQEKDGTALGYSLWIRTLDTDSLCIVAYNSKTYSFLAGHFLW